MLSINDLKTGTLFILDDNPYEALEVKHLHMGRGSSSIQTRIRNLRTGQVYSRNFKPADMFAEADIEKKPVMYLYHHRDEFVFHEKGKPQNRFPLPESITGEIQNWLKPNMELEGLFFEGTIIAIKPPIKLDLKVVEAPPAIRGDTAQGGTKTVKLETGVEIQVPLFINEGDTVRVNTGTGLYTERVEKGKT
ncbi:MAG: elongation factor P [bacterium]|nr:elongation factor P [bacterium]